MSATLALVLRRLLPDARISIFERLTEVAAESSDAQNNAGTGHSAFCELNYTPYENGKIDISKALQIAESFEISKQFWAYLVEQEFIKNLPAFINRTPHMSFVVEDGNVAFLSARHQAMSQYAIFRDMQFSDDKAKIAEWIPLMMEGRSASQRVAATKMDIGTDVNFGLLTEEIIACLDKLEGYELNLGHEVSGFAKKKDSWIVKVKNTKTHKTREIEADFVFIGAGGGTLPLLEKTDIKEAVGYGGFPISGQFLRCDNPDVVKRHQAKVYGKAAVGAPPMSVPHLDTRVFEDGKALYFGPYAGFSTKFLKNGSYFDLPLSLEAHNIWPVISAGINNLDLAKYLVNQVTQTDEERFEALLDFYPNANSDDWKLTIAGQRVQIIKKDKSGGGVLKFGTEIICSGDQSVVALLGASPGASTSVSIVLEILERAFPDQYRSDEWQIIIKTVIPSHGESLIDNESLCMKTRDWTSEILGLK
ncbi:MAG: malate dehydrogenase (quinone) [Gammaproteobacteria bacterium]|nr:malate dehydrogenase (quinone) [Gammaproteobacteria bacterium]